MVSRYRLAGYDVGLDATHQGGLVLYSDYAALEADRAQLIKDHAQRVADLLETTNRYLVRARKAEALLRIPDGDDKAFAQWRDSLPAKHWARYDLSACRLGFDAGVELAARWVDQRCSDYVAEHGSYDGSTGLTEFSSAGEEYVGELDEIAEGLRAMGRKS